MRRSVKHQRASPFVLMGISKSSIAADGKPLVNISTINLFDTENRKKVVWLAQNANLCDRFINRSEKRLFK